MALDARREASPAQAAAATSGGSAPSIPFAAIRDQLAAMMTAAIRLADAVRSEGAVAMPIILDEPDPETGPLEVKGFYEHFIDASERAVAHRLFAFATPEIGSSIDPNAQFHLQQLIGEAMAFNVYAQRAHMDEALGVALQSPDVPARVDSLLLKSAFFTAVLDNLSAREAKFGGRIDEATLAYDKANLERHVLMAKDKMLDPERALALMPVRVWPFYLVEQQVAPHDGDYFINLVYFPAEYATILLETAKSKAKPAPALDAVA